jgi:hypothetical protein
MALGQAGGRAPRLLVGFGIEMDWQQCEISQSAVSKVSVVPAAAYAHFQNIGYLDAPLSMNPRATLTEQIKNVTDGFSRFVTVHPSLRDRTIED